MTEKEFHALVEAVTEGLKPILEQQLTDKVHEMTQQEIRLNLEGLNGQEIRTLIRNKIQDSGFFELRYIEKPQW